MWKYCPLCASPLNPAKEENMIGICSNKKCAQHWYKSSPPSAAAIISKPDHKETILLITRNIPPQKGLNDLPGGFIHVSEEPEEGVRREVEEEIGVKLDNLSLQGAYRNPHYKYQRLTLQPLDLVYSATINQDPVVNDSELSSLDWFDLTGGTPKMAFISIEKAINDYQKAL